MKYLSGYIILMTILSQNMAAQPKFDLQGHRGARGLAPENSIPAFLKALEYGVTTLELDVVISKDKEVIVSHEPWMSETICLQPDGQPIPPNSMQRFNIYQMTWEEIQQYDCGSRFHPRFTEQRLQPVHKPRLLDVFDTVEAYIREHQLPEVWYNIETKSLPQGDNIFHPVPDEFAKLLYDLLKDKGMLNKVYIQSFDVRTLQAMRRLDSSIPLVLLVENAMGLERNLELLGFTPQVYSPFYLLVNQELVEAVRAKGMKIIPWTVNDPRDLGIIIDMGVDGLITDYPDRGKSMLMEKGLWPIR